MRAIRRFALSLMCLTLAAATSSAQETLSADLLDRFVTAHDRERELLTEAEPKLAEIEERIRKFRECKTAFEAAGSMSGSRLGGLAARAGIRARCGANSEGDIAREKKQVTDKATSDAATAAGFTVVSYTRLRTRLERIYANGDRAGLSAPEVEAVESRAPRFANIFGVGTIGVGGTGGAGSRDVEEALNSIGITMGRPGGARTMPGQWTADASWAYVNYMFVMLFGAGANVIDTPYAPGQWTRWRVQAGDEDEQQLIERAFLAAAPDGSEWWRLKSITTSREGSREVADTIVFEGLFKRVTDGTQQLVRMRRKMPGDREPSEMLIPQDRSKVNTWGMFESRPTPESLEGATTGTETIRTPAGSFTAKRIRFGSPGGQREWWTSSQVPGGWVKYRVTESEDGEQFVMELVAHGTGAKSELGVN